MNWTDNNLTLSTVTTFIYGVGLKIEFDQINIVQTGNIINLLSATDSDCNLTTISMNHSKIKNVFSEEQVSAKLSDSILHLSNSSFSYVD